VAQPFRAVAAPTTLIPGPVLVHAGRPPNLPISVCRTNSGRRIGFCKVFTYMALAVSIGSELRLFGDLGGLPFQLFWFLCGIPTAAFCAPSVKHLTFPLKFAKEGFNLVPRQTRQGLSKGLVCAAFVPVTQDVLEQERLVGFSVKSPPSGVYPRLSKKVVQTPGQNMPCTAPSSKCFYDPLVFEVRDSGLYAFGHRPLAVQAIEDKQILNAE